MKPKRNWSDLIILFLLPAPVTGIAIMLLLVYVIGSGFTVTLNEREAAGGAVAAEPTRTLSANAAALATLNAAPPLPPAPTATPIDVSSGAVAEVASALGYSQEMVAAGREDFLAVCASCHGTDALGISGLGKPLVGSEFVNSLDDQQLLAFVTTGRPVWDPANTTGVDMPPRGGNPGLTDDDILQIISYIRILNGGGPTTVAAAGQPSAGDQAAPANQGATQAGSTDTTLPSAEAVPSGASSETSAETSGAAAGETVFDTLCGGDKADKPLCAYLQQAADEGMDSATLFSNIQLGATIFNPDGTVNLSIPPRGGMPPLTDEEIQALVDYVLGASAGSQPAAEVGASAAAGEAVFNTLCGGDKADKPLCAYLQQAADEGMDSATLFSNIQLGATIFNPDGTVNLSIPPRGGMPPLTDEEIQALVDYVLGAGGAAEDISATWVPYDVNGLLASLGVVLPDPIPLPERDGEAIFNSVCAVWISYDIPSAQPNLCTFLTGPAKDLDEEELFHLLQHGDPIWAAENVSGVHIPARAGYPPLSDEEIQKLIEYVLSL